MFTITRRWSTGPGKLGPVHKHQQGALNALQCLDANSVYNEARNVYMYCKRRLKTFLCCKMGEFYTMCNVLWSHSVYLSRISVPHSITVLQCHTLHSCLLQNVPRANKPSFCIHGDHCNKLRKNCFTSAGIYFMDKLYKTSTSDIENCTNFLPESVINTLKLIYIWNGHRNQINIIGNLLEYCRYWNMFHFWKAIHCKYLFLPIGLNSLPRDRRIK